MIYEVRTYTLKPGGVPQFEQILARLCLIGKSILSWEPSGTLTSAL